jgi:hypothetical protein
LNPYIGFGFSLLEGEESAARLFGLEQLIERELELEIGLLVELEKLGFFGFHLLAAEYVHGLGSDVYYIYFINWKG